MAKIMLKGNPIETIGELPAVGTTAPAFTLTKTDMTDVHLSDFAGKRVVLNISPSIDTSICAASVRRFNQEATRLKNTAILYISMDLPFAHGRFCSAEGLSDVIPASTFRAPEFGQRYGLTMTSGALRGLLSRAVIVIDESGKVLYTEQVPEIAQEPNYEAALLVLRD